MPKTWSEARRSSQNIRTGVQASRAPGDIGNVALPRAKERFKRQVCVYCGGTAGRKVGYLTITGPVMYCKMHVEQYKSDKEWESIHKKGL